jgi:hypothetical protein
VFTRVIDSPLIHAAAYIRTFLVLAVALAATALWQAHHRRSRHSDAADTRAVAREWRRRRLAVDLGAARTQRHDALAARDLALGRTVPHIKTLYP